MQSNRSSTPTTKRSNQYTHRLIEVRNCATVKNEVRVRSINDLLLSVTLSPTQHSRNFRTSEQRVHACVCVCVCEFVCGVFGRNPEYREQACVRECVRKLKAGIAIRAFNVIQ